MSGFLKMDKMYLEGQLPAEKIDSAASTLAAIGLRIREIRLARGMTLQDLAKGTKLSASMLSLVERGRASPSIGSLIVIANVLGLTMSDLITSDAKPEDQLVSRAADAEIIETAHHVVRRLLREDRNRGISIALNEYAPHTGSAERPISHEGFEYGYVLKGEITVEVAGIKYRLQEGDLIAYSSRRKHKIWNHGSKRVQTLWFNIDRD